MGFQPLPNETSSKNQTNSFQGVLSSFSLKPLSRMMGGLYPNVPKRYGPYAGKVHKLHFNRKSFIKRGYRLKHGTSLDQESSYRLRLVLIEGCYQMSKIDSFVAPS